MTSAEIVNRSRSFQRAFVTYLIAIQDDSFKNSLTEKVKSLLKAQQLILHRTAGGKGKSRSIDVRPFLESIDVSADEITIRCIFTPSGTVRVDEQGNLTPCPLN